MELYETLMDNGLGRFKDYQCDYELLTLPKGSYIFNFWDSEPIGLTTTGTPQQNAENVETAYTKLSGHRYGYIYDFHYTPHTDPERARQWIINKTKRSSKLYNDLLEIYADIKEPEYIAAYKAGKKIDAAAIIDAITAENMEHYDFYFLPEKVTAALWFVSLAGKEN